MKRFVAPFALAGLLAACNTGDSILEWDEETAAMLAAQEAEAEAAAAGTAGDTTGQVDAGSATATEVPVVLLAADGTLRQGRLRRDPASPQVAVSWDDGDACTGGLVEQAPGAGTFALNCAGGDIWLGDYAEGPAGAGAWTLRDASGAPARALYGPDAAAASPDSFEALWQARGNAG